MAMSESTPAPEHVSRAAAEAVMRFKVGDDEMMSKLTTVELRRYVERFWDTPDLRVAVGFAYAAGCRAAAEAIEAPGSLLCNGCLPYEDPDEEPTNPVTGKPMDHHCECAAVLAAATILGSGSATVHARQCICNGPIVDLDRGSTS
jgi:hypothetical protein